MVTTPPTASQRQQFRNIANRSKVRVWKLPADGYRLLPLRIVQRDTPLRLQMQSLSNGVVHHGRKSHGDIISNGMGRKYPRPDNLTVPDPYQVTFGPWAIPVTACTCSIHIHVHIHTNTCIYYFIILRRVLSIKHRF